MSGVQWSPQRTSLQLLRSLIYSTGKWRMEVAHTYSLVADSGFPNGGNPSTGLPNLLFGKNLHKTERTEIGSGEECASLAPPLPSFRPWTRHCMIGLNALLEKILNGIF